MFFMSKLFPLLFMLSHGCPGLIEEAHVMLQHCEANLNRYADNLAEAEPEIAKEVAAAYGVPTSSSYPLRQVLNYRTCTAMLHTVYIPTCLTSCRILTYIGFATTCHESRLCASKCCIATYGSEFGIPHQRFSRLRGHVLGSPVEEVLRPLCPNCSLFGKDRKGPGTVNV